MNLPAPPEEGQVLTGPQFSEPMRVVMEHEEAKGRRTKDVSAKNLGYDVTSLDPNSGDLRLIEVKELAARSGTC